MCQQCCLQQFTLITHLVIVEMQMWNLATEYIYICVCHISALLVSNSQQNWSEHSFDPQDDL